MLASVATMASCGDLKILYAGPHASEGFPAAKDEWCLLLYFGARVVVHPFCRVTET